MRKKGNLKATGSSEGVADNHAIRTNAIIYTFIELTSSYKNIEIYKKDVNH